AVEHDDGAVQDAQAALDLDREVDVAGRVDQVQLEVAPWDGRRGRRDGDAALALLRHPVHLRLAVVHLADLVDASRMKPEALADRRLAGVDVRDDADVARARDLRGFGRRLGHGRPGGGIICTMLRSLAMEARIVELEVRYSHLERQYAELSQVVFEQQKMIEALQKELVAVRGKLAELGDPIANERPPHY